MLTLGKVGHAIGAQPARSGDVAPESPLEAEMASFELYIEDSRYAVPTLVFIEAPTTAEARLLATEVLAESPHHLSVEVCLGGKPLLKVQSRRRGPRSAPEVHAA